MCQFSSTSNHINYIGSEDLFLGVPGTCHSCKGALFAFYEVERRVEDLVGCWSVVLMQMMRLIFEHNILVLKQQFVRG